MSFVLILFNKPFLNISSLIAEVYPYFIELPRIVLFLVGIENDSRII